MLTSLVFLGLLFPSSQTESIPSYFKGPFPITHQVFHVPGDILFKNRPYPIEVFTEFPPDSIESISLFLKTDSMDTYREIPLPPLSDRYRHSFDPREVPGSVLSYFFILTLKNYALYATPLDSNGTIQPVQKPVIDPVEYYKWKARKNR